VSGNRKILPPERKEKDEKDGIVAKRAPSRNGVARTTSTTATAQQKPDVHQQSQPTVAAVLEEDNSAANLDALYSLLSSFRTLAIGTYATTRFDTNLALKTFRSLPSAQRETPYVFAQLGRAHYEATNYNEAAEAFARCLKLQPSRVKDMEVYSTVLWHLKKEAALAFLCHSLRDTAPGDPETWVAVGNAFSLSREHDSAISAFRRAVQIDPKFAYAWALMGHEYIANEDFDAALSCFRHAVACNRRGFGGWYGLGKCFERVGKLEDAERHYRIASSINPSNATLLVCVGVVLEKLRNRQAALSHYTKALELAPSSALARFKKARVLMHLRCFDEALVELEVLRGVAGEEANVWFLLGKCYKGLGMRGEGVGAFTRAVGLDVKVSWLLASSVSNEVGHMANCHCRQHLLSKKRWKRWMKMRKTWRAMTIKLH
jgi:anaphase-promoting complex subunit 3